MITRRLLANALRFLSIDAVELAHSGHPGMPMGMADIAQVLWGGYLKHNPANPHWFNRDRFVLSNGHGSMLLYSLLHLTGYDLCIEDLKEFRQLHSRTPGHPEVGVTPGVEITTGPLGQGLAGAVGMALAERLLANEFNRPGHNIVDHHTYCFVGDGCLMEGISHEVGSLAGTLGLHKLIVFWDDNGISIDGAINNWCQDNTAQRFQAYGWNVIPTVDGHDPDAIIAAIDSARTQTNKPTLICCQTHIGYGAPNLVDNEQTHGSPLGASEVQAARLHLQWEYPAFVIPEEIYQAWDATTKGQQLEQNWQEEWQKYTAAFPELAKDLERRINRLLPNDWPEHIHNLLVETQKTMQETATRVASRHVLDTITQDLPELIGGSADLTASNCTMHKNAKVIKPNELSGNYIHYGVREFGMSAIMNGIALHGGFIPYGGTFLTFADYARNAIRMSALMHQHVIYVYTHDSIGLGEDGPTHQPIEHLTMLRTTPNVQVWRPCDATETVVAWQAAIERQNGPTCLALSRQNLTANWRSETMLAQIKRGGYVLQDCSDFPNAIIIATGSEVAIAVAAADQLMQHGFKIRVISMPCVEVFLQQNVTYRSEVLPETVAARVIVEAGAREYWYQFAGIKGKIIGLHTFGASAPAKDVYHDLGLTVEAVVVAVKESLSSNGE